MHDCSARRRDLVELRDNLEDLSRV
jgi:hypothetical protein